MTELLNGLGNVLPYVKLAAVVAGVALVLIAAAALMYVLQSTFRPVFVVTQWLVGYTPGEKPGEIVRGISYGARMLVWAALIGVTVWMVFH
jgi:hypothetical protein